MKINKEWVIQNILFSFIYFVVLYALWKINISSGGGSGKILISIAAAAVGSLSVVGLINNIFKGDAYYKYIDMPMDDFNVVLYNNRIIIVHENHAWSFTHKKDKIAKLEEIKTLHKYTIKKEFIGWQVTPYIKL